MQCSAQINAQGGIDKWLTSERGRQAITQIGAQGAIDRALQVWKTACSRLVRRAQDRALQGMRGTSPTAD